MIGCSFAESIGEKLSLVSGPRCTIERLMIVIDNIWNFEFGGGVSITSGVESFTNSGSIIMPDLIKGSVVQVDHWYCEVTTTYI